MIWKRYCGTAAKAGGNRENKLLPAVTGGSCLLEILDFLLPRTQNSIIACRVQRKVVSEILRSFNPQSKIQNPQSERFAHETDTQVYWPLTSTLPCA